MKLGELKAENETITPLHPSLGDVGVKFEVCSPFSREFNKATARIHGEIFGENKDNTANDWEILQTEALMVGWSGIEDNEGNNIDFSAEECSKLFRDPAYYWMVSQVSEHLSKKKGYLETMQRRLQHLSK